MLQLNPIFTDHMVLAARTPVRIYGEGEGTISVCLNGVTAQAQAAAGRFMVSLPAMPAGGPYEMTVSDGSASVTLTDVYLGRVYLCAGQSNMQLRLEETDFPAEQYEGNSLLRFFATARPEDGEPFSPADGWMISTKETAALRTAIGYIMGGDITRETGEAVGIVCCYQGASVIESWVPEGAYQKIGVNLTAEEKGGNHTEPLYAVWNPDGMLYNFCFRQVVPFAMSGVVWYQGESDSVDPEAPFYARELAELIRIWREDLMDDQLPFVIVQLADFVGFHREEAWKIIQQQQMDVMQMTGHVRTVVCADVCQNDFIHPVEKQELSHRVSQALLEGF